MALVETPEVTDPDRPEDWTRRKFVFDSLFVGGMALGVIPIVSQTLKLFAAGNAVDKQVDGQYPLVPASTREPALTQIAQFNARAEDAAATAVAHGSYDVYVHVDDPQQLTAAYEVIGLEEQRSRLRNKLSQEQAPIRDFFHNLKWSLAGTVGGTVISFIGLFGSARIGRRQHPVSAELE